MMHRSQQRVIAGVLLFSHTLMSCFNPSIGPDKRNFMDQVSKQGAGQYTYSEIGSNAGSVQLGGSTEQEQDKCLGEVEAVSQVGIQTEEVSGEESSHVESGIISQALVPIDEVRNHRLLEDMQPQVMYAEAQHLEQVSTRAVTALETPSVHENQRDGTHSLPSKELMVHKPTNHQARKPEVTRQSTTRPTTNRRAD